MTQTLRRLALASFGLGFGTWALNKSIYNVDGGERAVIWDRFKGVLPKVKGEGTHFRIPLIQYPTIFDIRLHPREISTVTGTKDLQMVNISLRVLSKPEESHLPWIFRHLGTDFDERVLPSLGNEVMKAVVAQYNADQLLSMREQVSQQIFKIMNERSSEFHIQLDDVSITHLTFGREFTRAIEHKQVAQQEAERSKFVVLKAEQEKQAAIIRAEGESEAAKMISESVTKSGSGLIEVRRIDTARDIAETLAKSQNVVYVPGNTRMLMDMH